MSIKEPEIIEGTAEEIIEQLRLPQHAGQRFRLLTVKKKAIAGEKETPLSVEEWEAELDELTRDVNPSLPPLTNEALSRRSIYGSRA